MEYAYNAGGPSNLVAAGDALRSDDHNVDLHNYYLAVNMGSICRICLDKGAKLMPIFDAIKPPHFSVLIMACASVQVACIAIF